MAVTSTDSVIVGPSPIHGNGVFARLPIAAGDLVGTFEGEVARSDGVHVLWIEDEPDTWRGIDGTGVLRWLNHSRIPNTEFEGPELYALRPITTGEELTFDYGEHWADIP